METNNSVKECEPACFKTNRQKIENEFSVTTLIYAYSNIIIIIIIIKTVLANKLV